jgi:membrane-anchored protein YejM (alkaline phosphatase superfamily)
MTSHLDIPATLLTVLGVKNQPEDYSLGFDLFSKTRREFTVVSDWNNLVYMDQHYTAIFPLNSYGFNQQTLTTAEGLEVPDSGLFYKTCKPQLLSIMAALDKFSEH